MLDQQVKPWTVSDAAEMYEVGRWGAGYFSVDQAGHLPRPSDQGSAALDRPEAADRSLQLRGIDLPILIRFAEILKHRLGEIHSAFQKAMSEHQFKGNYFCVYPIKVNQQRQVVEEVLDFGRPFQFRARGRLEARAAGRGGPGVERHADHLQRLQGCRVHRDGDAGAEDRPPRDPGRREIHRAGPDPRICREGRRASADRHARQAGGQGTAAAGRARAATARSSG